MIKTTLITFCHCKSLVPFCLRKKRPENAFLTLIVNYNRIVQKNKLSFPKQQQIGYLMIYDVIPKQQQIDYLMIYDVIKSLLVSTEKLAFFKKQL